MRDDASIVPYKLFLGWWFLTASIEMICSGYKHSKEQ